MVTRFAVRFRFFFALIIISSHPSKLCHAKKARNSDSSTMPSEAEPLLPSRTMRRCLTLMCNPSLRSPMPHAASVICPAQLLSKNTNASAAFSKVFSRHSLSSPRNSVPSPEMYRFSLKRASESSLLRHARAISSFLFQSSTESPKRILLKKSWILTVAPRPANVEDVSSRIKALASKSASTARSLSGSRSLPLRSFSRR